MIDNAIHAEVEGTWREDIQLKSSLKYINPNKVKVGQCHPVWDTVRDNVYDSRRAQTKCRLLTGTYPYKVTKQSSISTLWTRHVNSAVVHQKLDSISWWSVKLFEKKGKSI